MPNLTQVSLNGIKLNKVMLDADKVMARFSASSPFHLRHGLVNEFELKPTGTGLSIIASGVDVVIVITMGELAQPEELEQSIADSISEMLAHSSAELARVLEDDSSNEPTPKTSGGGVVGGVVARAVELALARLSVEIHRIKCKIVFSAEIDDVVVAVDRITYSTVEGTKKVEVAGVKVLVASEAFSSISSSVSSADTDNGLMQSTMFMSALSNQGSKDPEKAEPGVKAIAISSISLSIPPDKMMAVEIDVVHLSLPNVCSSVAQFCTVYTHHLKYRELKRKRDVQQKAYEYPPKYPTEKVVEDTSEQFPLEVTSLKINSVVIGMVGTSSDLELSLSNLYVKKKDDSIIGGVETVEMGFPGQDPVLYYEQDPERRKADIRFESQLSIGDTIYIAMPLRVELNENVVKMILNVVKLTSQVTSAYSQLILAAERDNHQCEHEVDPRRLVVQTAESFITFGDFNTLLQMAPIHYNSAKRVLKMAETQLSVMGTPVATVGPINVEVEPREFPVEKTKRLFSDITVLVERVAIEINQPQLDVVTSISKWFSSRSKESPPSSRLTQKCTTADWRVVIKQVEAKVRELPVFEGVQLSSSQWQIYSFRQEISASIARLTAVRISDKGEHYEQVVGKLWPQKSAPMIQVETKAGRIDILLSAIVVDYYTYWLTLKKVDNDRDKPDASTPFTESSESKFRITTIDCAIGLTPGRIVSHCYLHLDKMVVDMVVGGKTPYTKASVNGITGWIIDDVNCRSKLGILHSFSKGNYLRVLNISKLHFGVSQNRSFDVKINVDKVALEVCADSWQVFMSLFCDLSVPPVFTDSERFRVQLEQPLNLWEHAEELGNNVDVVNHDDEDMAMSMSLMNIQENYVPVTPDVSLTPEFRLHVNISEIKVYLYDGYDWSETRHQIRSKVKQLEKKVSRRSEPPMESEGPAQETMFRSVHMTMSDPEEFMHAVNRQIHGKDDDDMVRVELDNYYKSLDLHRSQSHKMMAVTMGTEIIVESYTDSPLSPTRSQVEVMVDDFSVLDNLQSSSWTKAVGYQHTRGIRELGTSMLKVQFTQVRADPRLEGSGEGFLNVSVLPLRLHLDQDTIGFTQRFFTFANPKYELPDSSMFFSKVSVGALDLKVDYKPRKQGHGFTSPESLMSMFVIDGSKIKLMPVSVFGAVSDKLGQCLTTLGWIPQLQSNYSKMFGLLLGVGPLKSLVNIGDGFKDLVVVPYKAYAQDKSLLRGLRKGTTSFARKTGGEFFSLAAKLVIGTQNLLLQAETTLQPPSLDDEDTMYLSTSRVEDDGGFFSVSEIDVPLAKSSVMASSQVLSQKYSKKSQANIPRKHYTYDELDELEEPDDLIHKSLVLLGPVESGGKRKSLYSDQPESVEEGIHAAYKALGQNFSATKRVLLRIKGDIGESESLQEAFITVLRSSPLVLIRPIIGTTEIVGKTLMGVGNALDPQRASEARDKYGTKA